MTFEEYINNPLGQKNALFTAAMREANRSSYTSKFDNILLREKGAIAYNLYVESNGTYWALIKVPSEVVKKFYYDVVIKFTGSASTGGGGNLSKYDVQFFSNDPAFVYNYAHAFNTRGLFIKELSSKMSKEALKKEPVEKNPQENIGYVKSIYFAYLTMQRRQLFRKSVFESEAIKFDPKLLLSQIEPADSKIQRRQDEGAKANTRKKVTVDKDTYGRMRRYMRDGEDYSRLQVQTTKKVGKVTRANPVVKSSVKKTSKVKRK